MLVQTAFRHSAAVMRRCDLTHKRTTFSGVCYGETKSVMWYKERQSLVNKQSDQSSQAKYKWVTTLIAT